jgi:hypothetical protein
VVQTGQELAAGTLCYVTCKMCRFVVWLTLFGCVRFALLLIHLFSSTGPIISFLKYWTCAIRPKVVRYASGLRGRGCCLTEELALVQGSSSKVPCTFAHELEFDKIIITLPTSARGSLWVLRRDTPRTTLPPSQTGNSDLTTSSCS